LNDLMFNINRALTTAHKTGTDNYLASMFKNQTELRTVKT